MRARYDRTTRLGKGGSGTAWRAVDRWTGKEVALKALAPGLPPELLLREFRLLAGLAHPHLATVYDVGFGPDGEPFLTAELIEGPSLAEIGDVDLRAVTLSVLRALAFLHRVGIRHGDVTPANILVPSPERARLVDLSAASLLSEPLQELSGTPGYLAPEAAHGRRLDGRADLYGLGETLVRVGAAGPLRAFAERLREREPARRPAGPEAALELLGAPTVDARVGRAPELYGREEAIAEFDHVLDGLLSRGPGRRGLCVDGAVGLGRTRMLQELRWRAAARRVWTVEAPASVTVADALGRSLGRSVQGTLPSLLEACDELMDADHPAAIFFDDVDRRPVRERRQLRALLRKVGDAGALLLCVAGEVPEEVGAARLPLRPLTPEEAEAWRRAVHAPDLGAARLEASTGLRPAWLAHTFQGVDEDPSASIKIAFRDGEEDTLARLFLFEEVGEASVPMVDESAASGLAARGWIRWSGDRWALAARRLREPLRSSLSPPALNRAAEHLPTRDSPVAQVTLALLRGDRAQAVSRFLSASHETTWPAPLRHQLFEGAKDSRLLRELAAAGLAAGDVRASRAALDRVSTPDARVLQLRAAIELRSARPKEALAAVEEARARSDGEEDPEPGLEASLADLEQRALLGLGRYREAAKHAEAFAQQSPRSAENLALARAYLGEVEAALTLLDELAQAYESSDDAPGLLRALSYRAIALQRAGQPAEAARTYQRALRVAERAGFDDQLAGLWLNLGAAALDGGRWGDAAAAFERGLELVVVPGTTGIEATLSFNLANLYTEIGAWRRAEGLVRRTRELAQRHGLHHIDGPLARLEAELAAAQDRSPEEPLARARKALASSPRDLAECDLIEASAAPPSEQGRLLRRARARAEDAGARDLVHRADLRLARDQIVHGDPSAGLRSAKRLHATLTSEGGVLQAQLEQLLAEAYEANEAESLAEEHRRRAVLAWEAIEVTLDAPALREAFRDHPDRRGLSEIRSRAPRTVPATETHFERFLEVNRRLTSSLEVERVLENAVDAAVELAGAERGFVLLTSNTGQELEVAAARGLDRSRLDPGDSVFSRTIARRVIAEGAPVVTFDAQRDERFSEERSVHAMRLQSVACVPIRGSSQVRGALYLDSRWEQGRFSDADLRLVEAFADQVAIGVMNAELHTALAERTRELEAAKEKLEERVEGQAQTIAELHREVENQREALAYRFDYARIIGRSAPMQRVLELLDKVIDSELSVLVEGESGTGKELIARTIHTGSRRRGRLVSLNCAALPENLLESLLFGHVRGAFSGAESDSEGLLRSASGGTVFLDEIGEMPTPMQAKLLRVLQEREVFPLGASAPVTVDFRLVAATNRHLEDEVAAGRFRQDLFYRIGVVRLELPPLRERPADLPALVEHFLEPEDALTEGARQALFSHDWPGNVRELENSLARGRALAGGRPIDVDDLGLPMSGPRSDAPDSYGDYEESEAMELRRALAAHRWNVTAVSRALEIPRQTLYRRLKKYGLERPSRSEGPR